MLNVKKIVIPVLLFLTVTPAYSTEITEHFFDRMQPDLSSLTPGDRIAFWAEQFVGVPYDPDPLGEYVRTRQIVSDERIDCMYHTFRSVELALSSTYRETVTNALNLRFHSHGKLDAQGKVVNYDDRFRYGIDMIRSGKWGRNVSGSIAKTTVIQGERGIETVEIIDKASAIASLEKIVNGDIIFFIKGPSSRKVGEIVGHIGIAVIRDNKIYLIHASGMKNTRGSVKKVPLRKYLDAMPFIGIMVMRFD